MGFQAAFCMAARWLIINGVFTYCIKPMIATNRLIIRTLKCSLKTSKSVFRLPFAWRRAVNQQMAGLLHQPKQNKQQQQNHAANNRLLARGLGRGLLDPAEFTPEPENQAQRPFNQQGE